MFSIGFLFFVSSSPFSSYIDTRFYVSFHFLFIYFLNSNSLRNAWILSRWRKNAWDDWWRWMAPVCYFFLFRLHHKVFFFFFAKFCIIFFFLLRLSSTGDVGQWSSEGYLKITDRLKEFLKTAGGKMVAPSIIEARFKAFPIISAVHLVFFSFFCSHFWIALSYYARTLSSSSSLILAMRRTYYGVDRRKFLFYCLCLWMSCTIRITTLVRPLLLETRRSISLASWRWTSP